MPSAMTIHVEGIGFPRHGADQQGVDSHALTLPRHSTLVEDQELMQERLARGQIHQTHSDTRRTNWHEGIASQ